MSRLWLALCVVLILTMFATLGCGASGTNTTAMASQAWLATAPVPWTPTLTVQITPITATGTYLDVGRTTMTFTQQVAPLAPNTSVHVATTSTSPGVCNLASALTAKQSAKADLNTDPFLSRIYDRGPINGNQPNTWANCTTPTALTSFALLETRYNDTEKTTTLKASGRIGAATTNDKWASFQPDPKDEVQRQQGTTNYPTSEVAAYGAQGQYTGQTIQATMATTQDLTGGGTTIASGTAAWARIARQPQTMATTKAGTGEQQIKGFVGAYADIESLANVQGTMIRVATEATEATV